MCVFARGRRKHESEAVAMATPEAMVEEMSKLSVEQLRQVKEQVDGEVSVLQDSLTNIRTAANRFEMAHKALDMLSQQPPGRVPASSSRRGSSLCGMIALLSSCNVVDPRIFS